MLVKKKQGDRMKDELTISELAQEFNVTTRTIRYYEEIGMMNPKRTEGGQRRYSKREKVQLMLIFRGKKFGFTLEEIREMIQLFDQDPTGKKQMERTIRYGKEKIEEVDKRINELVKIREEMKEFTNYFEKELRKYK